MSEEQLIAFLEAVKANAGLQEKVKAADDAVAVVAIAKSAGFEISLEDASASQHVNDHELEAISGGGCLNPSTFLPPTPGPTKWIQQPGGNYVYQRC